MLKVLIVDDDSNWIIFHKARLSELFPDKSLEIEFACSAREAFNKAKLNKFYDLILSDLEMETVFEDNYAGCWLLKNLKALESLKNSKYIIISGSHDIAAIAKELKVEYIPKSHLIGSPMILKYKIQEFGFLH